MTRTLSSLDVASISLIRDYMPEHALIECPSGNGIILLWPMSNVGNDVYELDTKVVPLLKGLSQGEFVKNLQRAKRLEHQRRLHIAYKDYRVVDSSHVNKLHSLLHETYTCSEVSDVLNDRTPIVHGSLTMPGNFVLVTDFHKSVRTESFDSALGESYLKDKLEIAADAKLWELEGYRLYRSLMTIDGFHNTYGKNIVNLSSDSVDPAVYVANCATVYSSPSTDMVYLEICPDKHTDLIATSEGRLSPGLIAVRKEYYERITTVIDTYIEF